MKPLIEDILTWIAMGIGVLVAIALVALAAMSPAILIVYLLLQHV